VELTLTIGDSGPLDFRVTPVHAALLLQFADDSSSGGSGGNSTVAALMASPGSDMGSPQQQQVSGGVCKSASQLSAALGIPVPVVRRKAMFWVAAGVFVERRGAKGEVVYTRATRIDPSRIGKRSVC
jgi:hypothetical protein